MNIINKSMLFSLLLLLIFGFNSCKKDTNTNNNSSNTNPYYLDVELNGTDYSFNNQLLEPGNFFWGNFGGYINFSDWSYEAGGVVISIFDDVGTNRVPTQAEVLNLIGDTIFVNLSQYPHAIINFDVSISKYYNTWAVDSLQSGFVMINDITPLGTDNTNTWNIFDVQGFFVADFVNEIDDEVIAGTGKGDFRIRMTTDIQ